MIDWQVMVDGEIPLGWDRHKDGCWFPDFGAQSFLLPHFNVGNSPIDEFGKTVFDGDDMQRLRTHLLWQRSYLEAKVEKWTITETDGDRSSSYTVEREVVLRVVDKTLVIIERAGELKGELVFFGD